MSEKDNHLFLATTALEEFWDASKPLLFLGKWCFPPQRQLLSEKIVRNPLEDPQSYYEVNEYSVNLYEQVLPKVASVLNKIHGKNYSLRYWEILLWPWLLPYISQVYKRYVLIKTALKEQPGFETTGLSEESFITPINTLDFMNKIEQDLYNLQLFTIMLKFLGYDFPRKKAGQASKAVKKISTMAVLKKLLRSIYNAGFKKIYLLFHSGNIIIAKNTFFDPLLEYQLFFKSAFKIWVDKTEVYEQPGVMPDMKMRAKLNEVYLGSGEFERLLVFMLHQGFPQCFLESYEHIDKKASKDYPFNPKVIFTSTSTYTDEVFKFWAARSVEHGAILLGQQHGGYYGYYEGHFYTDYEIKINDKFYSWGWDSGRYGNKVVPFIGTKLAGLKALGADNRKDGILYTTIVPFSYRAFLTLKYDVAEWRSLFIKTLLPEILSGLRVRVRPGVHNLFQSMFPEHNIESWNTSSFSGSLKNSRLLVSDCCGTTFLESLSVNKPTIVFFNPDTNRLQKDAEPYFEELRKAGILYYRPEDAAHAVNAIYEDVARWWNDPHRQAVRARFCGRYAKTSSNPVGDWAGELLKYV